MQEVSDEAAPSPAGSAARKTGVGQRLGWLALSFVAAVLLAAAAVSFFGKGLRVPYAAMIDNFARYQNIRLPAGARSEHELKSFVIRLKSIDDFGRAYVNNRLVASSESPDRPLKVITWADHDEDYNAKFRVDRADWTGSEVDVRRWLRTGVNWIMIELENSRWGSCAIEVEFEANRTQLEGSPYFIPERQQIDTALSNPRLTERFKALAANTIQKKEFGIIPEFDAVCARIIFGFQLD
jgi:hypothetical protein